MVAADHATDPRRAIARRDVEKAPRRMRPSIMHICRERERAAARQRRTRDVDLVMRQLWPDAGVERHPVCGGYGHGKASPKRCGTQSSRLRRVTATVCDQQIRGGSAMPTALEEKDAIREVLAEYCFRLDGGSYDEMAALFTE